MKLRHSNFGKTKIALPRMLLLVSLAANFTLGGFVLWLLVSRGARPTPAADSMVTSHSSLPAVRADSRSPHDLPVAAAAQAPFSWEQLQSLDFPTYIAQLRGIHCPETTLRDIIRGELDEIYAEKRRQLLAQRGMSNPQHLPLSVQKELDALAGEEDRLLAQLLDVSSSDLTANVAEAEAVPVSPPPRRSAMEQVMMNQPLAKPLVLQEVDAASLNLTPSQQERLEQMRTEFLRMIGGTSQDPNDPQYLIRWKKAQYEMDARLRVNMGDDFVARYRAHVK